MATFAAQAQEAARKQRALQERETIRTEPIRERKHELAKLSAAQEAASAETAREREFESQEKKLAFERATGFLSTFFEEGTGGAQRDDAQTALEASISERGAEAQSELTGLLAQRGIFRSGSGAAAAAELSGATEAEVAKSRATFAESAKERKRKERATALQFLTSAGGFA